MGKGTAEVRLGTYYRCRLLRLLGFDELGGRVLDIGGLDGYWAASLDNARAIVIDLEPRARFSGVGYVQGDAMRLPFQDHAFDTVFALEVLEHVPDEAALLNEAFRVLRRGGRLVMTTPSATIAIFPRFLQPWVNRRWGHYRVPGFAPDYLERLFEGVPFPSLRVRPLAARAVRLWYFGLAVSWWVPGPIGRWLVDLAARWDSRHLDGENGFVLVVATR